MANLPTLIAGMYAAFNRRDVEGALAFMTERVSWPKASEGGRVVGKDEIRAYWGRQWREFNPQVTPLEVLDREQGRLEVRVHQLVRSLTGEVLSDSEVWHFYTVADARIERMDLEAGGADAPHHPSSGFAHRN